MDTKILIGGGVAAVFVGFLVIKKINSSDSVDESNARVMPDTGFFSGMAPISGGISSGGSGGNGGYLTPTVEGNSGTTDVGGGFDIMAIMGNMFAKQQETAQMDIRYGAQNFDSSIVGQIIGANGSATITHTANGTTITNSDGGSPFDGVINSIYKNELGRNADEFGSTYWKNQLLNNYQSISAITDNIRTSDEYKKLRGITTPKREPAGSTYTSSSVDNPDGTVTVTEKATR
jgi:hypothetical protein